MHGTLTAAPAVMTDAAQRVITTGIAILGSHPATVEQAPFDDPGWRIYACSPHNVEKRTLPRVDAWFELHLPVFDATRAYQYLSHLQNMPTVYMRDEFAMKLQIDGKPLFPTAVAYPERELYGTYEIQKIKTQKGEYVAQVPHGDGMFCPFQFTSSIAYMLAKAIADCEREGIKQISLFGIMQAAENEYTYQRPGLHYFIWEATRRGIKVLAPRESCLFDMPQWKW